jgi:hypothetical protein
MVAAAGMRPTKYATDDRGRGEAAHLEASGRDGGGGHRDP